MSETGRKARRFIKAAVGAASALLLAAVEVGATWYNENIEAGADLVMMDLRWPWWPPATYYANWNTGFHPQPNNLSFYAGIQSRMPDGPGSRPNPDEALQQAHRPGNTWSLWGFNAEGVPPRFIDVGPTLSMVNAYGGEGTSAFLAAMPWPFIKPGRWYTMLSRVWRPVGGGDYAYCGRWIKDHADGCWHLIGVAWLPIPATSFHGNSGFIEPLDSPNAVRALDRRLGYLRKNGVWKKADTISITKTVYVAVDVLPEGDHEYAAIEYAQRPDLMPMRLKGPLLDGSQKYDFKTRQPDAPVLDQPAVARVVAVATGSQVGVSWDIPTTSSPVLGYRIEVFDNPSCHGPPVALKEERMPSTRHALLEAAVVSPTVRLTVIDIFDQSTRPVILPAKPAAPAATPLAEASTVPGLAYELFHQDTQCQVNFWNDPKFSPDEEHYWLALAELEHGTLVRQGRARGFDRSVLEARRKGWALRYTGRLQAPADGLFLLRARIDGAYRLHLNGVGLLLRDGQFGASEQAAIVRLNRGGQRFEMTHLFDAFPGLPGANFMLEWEGPGLARQPIPLAALQVADDGHWPSVNISGRSAGDGTGQVRVEVQDHGRAVQQTKLFLGDLELASANQAGLEYNGPLPAGASRFWSRIVYDGNHTVDSEPFTLMVTGRPITAPWVLRNAGDSSDAAGVWQTGGDAFQFFGQGMHTVTRKMTGDFTMTVRVDACSGLHGEPVNPNSWAGLGAFEKPEALNWNWEQRFYLVQSAGIGLRAVPDFGDGAGTGVSSYSLPAGRPWLRIVRKGNLWMAWTSVDGGEWELGAFQVRRTPPDMHAGLFFRALKQESLAHFQARVSHLSITPGVAPGSELPVPPVARGTAGDRLTGVVLARSDAQVAVVRSSAFGLLRTTDGGATWKAANGQLTGSDLAVRSVAIHPRNPDVMLRACGTGHGDGRLWKTPDGGDTWTKLDFPGDFDGIGPSAICGEVVSFDVYRPDTLYAGTESSGCFRSTNAGAAWSELKLEGNQSLAGQRITSMMQWQWHEHHPAKGDHPRLCLTTAGDDWMPFLGRGLARTSTQEPRLSRVIFSLEEKVEVLQVAHERSDTGIYNAINDMAMVLLRGEMRFATTHGFQSEYSGNHMALYLGMKNLECMRPMTAMGAASMGLGNPLGRCIAQVLDPAVPGRYSRSHAWAFEWDWLTPQGSIPKGGLIAVSGDEKQGLRWWFVHTDGLYASIDGGATVRKFLDASGRVVPE